MTTVIEHISGRTFHGRNAEGVSNAFSYGVDYVLLSPEAEAPCPALFARDRRNIVALHDSDHGGPPSQGRGAAWVRDILADTWPDLPVGDIKLLAQPRILGHVFNPVSFWLIYDISGKLRIVIPEVTNTYGDRHSYLCHSDDLAPITPEMELQARKLMHVSPFQPVTGNYRFRFDIAPDRVAIRIDYRSGNGRLLATLTGQRQPLTTWGLVKALIRRPFGSRRVLALIHWQALKLWAKGAVFRNRPQPPSVDVSR